MNIAEITRELPTVVGESSAPTGVAPTGGFARVVEQLLSRVTGPAQSAEAAVNDLAAGRTDNLHHVLLAVAQADLAFRLALEVRNKLTEAYQEIQRMQVQQTMNYFGQLAQQLRQLWNGMTPARRAGMVAVLAGAMAVVLGVGYWVAQPDYRVLLNDVSADDASAITIRLKAQEIAYRLEAGGATILVPAEQLAQARMLVAADDLGNKSGKGFDKLFDQAPLGMTPSHLSINYKRALEAELARTIAQIEPIVQARVHLARPEPSPFLREHKPPTAAVTLRLKPGGRLNRNVTAGIVALVARSVEGLTRDNVTIVDTSGTLWTAETPTDGQGGAGPGWDQRRDFERDLSTRAESMLAQAIGANRAIVRVKADINFKRLSEKRETANPDNATKIKESTSSSKKTISETGGQTGITPVIGKTSGGVKQSGLDTTEKNDIDYFVPKTFQTIEDNKEEIERLTVAVLVDLAGDEKDGKSEPRMALGDVEEIVKRSVGFKTGRDDIKVTQVRFAGSPSTALPEAEWENLQRWQTVAQLVRQGSLGTAALAAMIIGWMALKRVRPARAQAAAEQPAPVPNPVLERMARTAQQDPEALARVLAKWLDQPDRPQRMAA